jgi:hypothetical protein
MTNPFLLARITKLFCQPASEPIALIKGPQGQKAGVRTDLSTGKISSNGLVSVEGKGQLWDTTRCHLWDAPKENAGFAKTQCSSILLEHPFFFQRHPDPLYQKGLHCVRSATGNAKIQCGDILFAESEEWLPDNALGELRFSSMDTAR